MYLENEDVIIRLAEQLRLCYSELRLIANTGSLDVGKALAIVVESERLVQQVESDSI